MNFGGRILPCLAVWLGATPGHGAEPALLPPIFSAPVAIVPVSEKDTARRSLLSDRVQRLITQAVLAEGLHASLTLGAQPDEQFSDSAATGPLLMEKYVVSSQNLRTIELEEPITPVDRFRKNGIVYESVGQKFTFDAMLYIDRWYSNRQGSGGTETRAELKFNLRW